MTSILNYLAQHAQHRPSDTLYTFLDGHGSVIESYTYQAFEERSNALAWGLLNTGKLKSGDHVLLVYLPGLDFIVSFFACVKLGAIPVPVAPPDASGLVGGLENLAHIATDTHAHVALSNAMYLQQMDEVLARSPEGKGWLQREPLASVEWLATDQMSGPITPLNTPDNTLLFLQYTSGSTQAPRGVMVSHDNVIKNAFATLQHKPTGVCWLPHYHDMGLIGYYLFIMILGGQTIGFSSANFLRHPALWLETISRYKGTVTSAPNFAFEYCLQKNRLPDKKLTQIDLSSLINIINAAEPARKTTYQRFQERFAPYGLSANAHIVYYGLAENTLSVTGGGRAALTVKNSLLERNQLKIEAARDDLYNQTQIMSCGRPVDGVDVRIVLFDTARVAGEDVIGEIWIGGDSKAHGYLNKLELSQTLFEAKIDGDRTSYLRSGDIGFMHEGELFVCGRIKDLIIISGRNYYPADIEAVVEASSPDVRQGCVAAFAIEGENEGEGIAVLLEATKPRVIPDLNALCSEIRKRCQIDVNKIVVVSHGVIPKTSSGKVARQLCRKRWNNGDITVISSHINHTDKNSDKVIEHLLNRFNVDGYDDKTLAELGIDSLSLVELSHHLEKIFKDKSDSNAKHASAPWWDLRILQAISVGELKAFLSEITHSGKISEHAPEIMDLRLKQIERDEHDRMKMDAHLPEVRIRPAAPVPDNGTILLTGATGFLGSFLLEALLRLSRYQIIVLVRASDNAHAKNRVASALERTGLFKGSLRQAFSQRVSAIKGDLTKPQLGLNDKMWENLSQELSAIHHCGAQVDYVLPYEQLHSTNVGSTAEIIRLACLGQPKALHYTSTTFMFGFVARERCMEDESNLEMKGLNFGYAQSKWVSEQIVHAAAARGLSIKIYRPSLITASKQGKYVRTDLMSRILSYMICQSVSPNVTNQLSFIPVDVCANNIVALSLLDDIGPSTFHITADNYYTMSDICESIRARFGYTFEAMRLEKYIQHMNRHCEKNDPMFPLLAFFNENWRRIDDMNEKRYDSRAYRYARKQSPHIAPEPHLDDVVAQIVNFLQKENLIPIEAMVEYS